MSRIAQFKVIVQRGNNLYYPKLVSAYTTAVYPFYAPTASIDINTNYPNSTTTYKSPIQVDDIIRLQVNVKNTSAEANVWQDIFEGRVMKIESRLGRDNLTTLQCRGHAEELLYRAVTADYSASATTTGSMLATLAGSYLTRLTDAGTSLIDSTNSTSITNYNIQQDTKYMVDIVRDFEALESYGYIFSVVPSYDSDGLLSAVYISWQPVSSSASVHIALREVTARLLEANFSESIEQVVEDITVYGQSGTPQKVGTYTAGSPTYNTRNHVETDLSLATDQLCSDLASAIYDRFGGKLTIGNAKILGDPNIRVGDLIYCRIPSITLSGSTVNGNYRIKRIVHQIGSDNWYTYLDLGDIIETTYDMLAGFHAKNRLLDANFID